MSLVHVRDPRALGVLALVGAAPFVLTMCSPGKPLASSASDPAGSLPATSSGGASARSAESTATMPSAAVATSLASAPASALGSASPASASTSTSAPLKALPRDCASLQKAIEKGVMDRSCKGDDDCANFAQHCGCAEAVSKAVVPTLQALKERERALDCYSKTPPRPCATCPPPPERHCVTGTCQ
jgi:hypothetical protein